jgi:hypothetical protein
MGLSHGTADNDVDNNAHRDAADGRGCQQWHRLQTMTPWPRWRATTQTMGKDADDNNAAVDVNVAMQMTRW